MVATKGHVCREPGQINYGQAPPFISTNMGSWRTPLNSNRDGFSVYPQFTAASCCIQRGPRSSKLMCTLRGKSKRGGCRLKYFSCTGSPLGGWVLETTEFRSFITCFQFFQLYISLHMTETARFWKPILSVTLSSPWHRYGDLQGLNKAETTNKFGEEQALGNVTPAIMVP